ncbi:MAG: hypothetical protein ACRYHQ_03365 [Janthinobacterium lividum]
MATPKQAAVKSKSKGGKGSKAACEAAGWKFAPIAVVYDSKSTLRGQTTTKRLRIEGGRGTMAIPPAGSGIEPRQFGGSIRAVAWAVEQLGGIAKQSDEAPAGMAGVRLLLSAALASGEICGGGDETPERPDAELLCLCHDVLSADRVEKVSRAAPWTYGRDNPEAEALSPAIDVKAKAAEPLTELHATTREGLLQKARAALVLAGAINITGPMRIELFRSLAVDLIHLVPTLIDERGRAIEPPATRR